MKRTLLALPALASSLMLASCGGGAGTSSKLDAEQASQIIEYYNQALEVFRDGFSAEKCGDVIEYMEKNGKMLIAPSVVLPGMFGDSAEMTAPGTCFGKSAGDSLTMLFRQYYAASATVDGNYDAFKAYLKAEDYKDDDWAKGKQLTEETKAAAAQIAATKEQILAIISGPADAAEALMMEGNPLKDHILVAKKIFIEMEGMMQIVAEENVDEQALTNSYNSLEGLVKQARALPKVEQMDSEMRLYDEYLKEVEEYMGVVRKAQRDGEYTQSVLDDMSSQYEYAVSDYNSFVD